MEAAFDNMYSDMSDEFEIENENEEEIEIKPYEIDCLPNDYNVSSLISLIERGYFRIPFFQRNYVWKIDMASKFIESIIIGLPIPQIFLFEKGRNDFLVVDGQQRLVTIYLFRNQRFPRNDRGRAIIREYLSAGKEIPKSEFSGENFIDFKLVLPTESGAGRENPLNVKKYDTLPSDDSFDFKGEFDFGRTIRTITIKQNTPRNDYSSMFEIFSRLNSGGTLLKPQEIRTSLYHSPFYEKVINVLNLHEDWRKFLGKDKPALHMDDVEALVRAFAMLELGNSYKSKMQRFLNDFSERATKFEQTKIDELKDIYDEFWRSCKSLDNNAFRNDRKKFVISLFDVVFVAVCEKIKEAKSLGEKTISPESLNLLKQNQKFTSTFQGAAASTTNVKTRLQLARETIVLQ